MTLDLLPRERRVLAVGGAVLALLAGARAVPAWLRWRADAVASAAELSGELTRTRASIHGVRTALDTTEVRVGRLNAAAPWLLVAREASDAPGELTDVVREAAQLSGVQVDGVESRVDSASGAGLPRVTATLQGTADVAGLALLLERLEGGQPLLAVRELAVQPRDVATPRDGVESLRVRLSVEALAAIRGDSVAQAR